MQVHDKYQIDPNFENNNGMEFLFKSNSNVQSDDGLIITGLMVRVLDEDPMDMDMSKWWTCWRERDYLHKNYYEDV